MVNEKKRLLRVIDKHALHWHLYNFKEPNYRDVIELLWGLRLEIDMDHTPFQSEYIPWLLKKDAGDD